MFNLRNLFCLAAIVLLTDVNPTFAQSISPNAQIHTQMKDGGVVDIVQLRTGIRVVMNVQDYVHLSLSNNQGRFVYSTTVHAAARTHTINTEHLPEGWYKLTAYTQEGDFEFDIKIE